MIHFNSSKILIPVDFSETSQLAIRHGAFTAQLTKGDVYLLHVVNAQYMAQNLFVPLVNLNTGNSLESKAEEKLVQLAQDLKNEYGIRTECIIKTGSPSSEIVATAKEIDASLIVMGTHGYSPLEELVIGSVALKVLTKSLCPTMAMSSEADHKGYNKILLPIDTSAHTRQKVNYTLEMAKKFSAVVHAVAVLGVGEDDEKSKIELILHQIEKLAKEKGVTYHSDVLTNVKNRATATVNYTEKVDADMMVIMTDQDAEISGFFLGPYAQQVIHLSKVPVIAIKPEEHPEDVNFTLLSGTSGI
ncbi:MAG: universal stress protein UspE [Bacteroidetes bacterium]|jgi:nucleotide-binding universal stress UspA family protein|nr:universal stress protein UspE [Bacteroidota bacterium]